RLKPRHEGVHFNLDRAAYKAGLYKDAVPPLERVLAAAPANTQAKQLLGMSYFMTGDYARASALLTDVVSVKHDNVGLYYTLALSLIKQGKQSEADHVIQQMILTGGNSPQLHIVLGQAFCEQGDTAKALEELKAALAL